MIDNFKKLFCSPKHCVVFYKSMILFVVTFNLFYMSVFMIAKSEGNPFINFVIFGFGLSVGMIASGVLLQTMQDAAIYLSSLCLILLVSLTRVQSESPSVVMISCLMFLQAFGCGILMNCQMIIVTSRTELSLLATALALNFCIGNVLASFAPALTAME